MSITKDIWSPLLQRPRKTMKQILCAFVVFTITVLSSFAQSSHYVGGYYRSDGTYVPGHYQTNSNGNPWDNWSTRGNYNPYTGKPGTVDPYAPRSHYNSQGHYYYDAYGKLHYSDH